MHNFIVDVRSVSGLTVILLNAVDVKTKLYCFSCIVQ